MADPKNRPTRLKLDQRNTLTTDQRPGFIRRMVNDVNGRVEKLRAFGYDIVGKPTQVGDERAGAATQVGSVVRKPVGGGIDAVLMEIPEEFYREDQQAKVAKTKEVERALLAEANEGFYGEGVRTQSGLGKPRVKSDDD